MRAVVVIQARMGSTRFPGKSMARIQGHPILWHLFRQLEGCRSVDAVILATTDLAGDDVLAAYAEGQGWAVFRGSSDDVLDRYWKAASQSGAAPEDAIIRLTGDDILPDPAMIDTTIGLYRTFLGRIDYVTTDRAGNLPYGAGIELCSFRALSHAATAATEARDREHVTPFIRENPELFPALEIRASEPMGSLPLSIDRPEDLERNARLIDLMSKTKVPPFSLADVLDASVRLEADMSGNKTE